MSKFNELFSALPTVDYSEGWSNGTGYMDGAVNEEVKEPVSFTDPSGRKGVILPLAGAGNVVLFERYTDRDDIVVANTPRGMSPAWLHQDVSGEVGRIVNAIDRVNVSPELTNLAKAYWRVALEIADTAATFKGGSPVLEGVVTGLPKNVANKVYQQGLVKGIIPHDGEVAQPPTVKGGQLMVTMVATGGEYTYTPCMASVVLAGGDINALVELMMGEIPHINTKAEAAPAQQTTSK